MPVSIDEYKRQLRNSEPGRERVQQLRADIYEAVRASAVTGDANWDHFLARLEGRIKAYESNLAAVQAVLCHPDTVNVDTIMAAKIKIVALEASAQALREIIDLPKLIIERGGKAKDALCGLEITEP